MKPSRLMFWHMLRLLCILLIPCFLLLSCGEQRERTKILSYQTEAFTAEIRGELCGAAFAGTLTHTVASAPSEADSYTLNFTSPDALNGITVSVQAKQTAVSLNGIRISDDRWRDLRWTEIAHLFALDGEVLSAATDRSKTEMTVILQESNGRAYTVILNSKTSLPRWIESDGIWVEILSFT